jgi:hypothetical protein
MSSFKISGEMLLIPAAFLFYCFIACSAPSLLGTVVPQMSQAAIFGLVMLLFVP